MDDTLYLRRAMAAYYRTGGTDQPSKGSRVITHEGLSYVALEVGGGYLVYRITNEGQLRRLRRPPKGLLEALA